MSKLSGLKLFHGSASTALANDVAKYIGSDVSDSSSTRFADGETQVTIKESARGNHVYLMQSTCAPTNDTLMEACLMLDAFKRASAKNVTLVTPYFGYARQDKKTKPREPISAKLVADFIQVAGANRVIAIDLHSEQIQGFFNIPVDHLYAGPLFGKYFKEKKKFVGDDYIVVSPDVSGTARAKYLADYLGTDFAIISKRRSGPNKIESMRLVGDVEDKVCIIIDDMMDTCTTLVSAAGALLENGAKAVHVACTHPVLSGNASQKLFDSAIESVACLDTIPIPAEKMNDKITVLSSAPLIGEAIKRHHQGDSVSALFEEWR